MHDEAELRGHRRTYIGAMPGRLIQAVRRAGVNNPVLMLDEIDKLGRDYRGDPAAALLEILDPAQNNTFRDNYLDLPFDLSKVLFITTANALDTIPRPLLDRMEVLRLSGYSEEEKVEIARRYLIPRQLKEAGLTDEQVVIPDETLSRLIRSLHPRGRAAAAGAVDRPAGPQGRAAVRRGQTRAGHGRARRIWPSCSGRSRSRRTRCARTRPPGWSTGLAWTEAGGDVLYVEATLLPDGKGLTLTGQLGDVMKESARAAQSWVWSHAEMLGIDPRPSRRPAFTSTCRRARSRRTARRPAWRW